ncbi:Hypothetical protein Tpal_552 [Trichococcus palustris]|jgi:uncharacterized membrane protein YsdA (DUF1294 family)|uniref:DUF1294 domain-containing protein n=1 Tax=Trichococcus palustris TaxID=140314 RepID=A0A143YEA7_9LACT|nr:DUF1294 domain-containing protein [Trichococcus palustris]CZQ84866.1 Hypothetical protein Tpal_552 [Trichococcus palustris]SFK54205.1 Uncharacterized membrane protein YsdA, DUF1294 family [Trichococcus palustris]
MAIQDIYLIVVNLALFGMMGIDKEKAKKHAWRIPEKNLLLLGLLGGGLGGLLGMRFFRHKTKHTYFAVTYFAGVILSGIAYYYYGF